MVLSTTNAGLDNDGYESVPNYSAQISKYSDKFRENKILSSWKRTFTDNDWKHEFWQID